MVAGTDADGNRLEVAGRLGANVIVNVDEEDPVSRAKKLTQTPFSAGLDFVSEGTGNSNSVLQALSMVRAGGKAILIGIYSTPVEPPTTDLVRNTKSVLGTYAAQPEIRHRCLCLLASGRIQVEPVITHRYPLSEARNGFELAVRKEARVFSLPGYREKRLAQIPLGRMAQPDDIAKVMEFFVTDLGDYITGQCLSVCDGAITF